jgi:hypothetical protein
MKQGFVGMKTKGDVIHLVRYTYGKNADETETRVKTFSPNGDGSEKSPYKASKSLGRFLKRVMSAPPAFNVKAELFAVDTTNSTITKVDINLESEKPAESKTEDKPVEEKKEEKAEA